MRHTTVLLVGLIVLAADARAQADFIEYSNRSAFLAAAGVTSTETFDEYQSGTEFGKTLTLGGVTYSTPVTLIVSVAGGSESSPNSLEASGMFDPTNPLSMNLSPALTAFGFSMILPNGRLADAAFSITVTESDGSSTSKRVDFTTAAAEFFGYIESTGSKLGLSSVTITPLKNSSGNAFGIAVDDVTTGMAVAVPEPSSLSICGIAAILAAGMAWRRRHRLA